jgi:hypothetical protein
MTHAPALAAIHGREQSERSERVSSNPASTLDSWANTGDFDVLGFLLCSTCKVRCTDSGTSAVSRRQRTARR